MRCALFSGIDTIVSEWSKSKGLFRGLSPRGAGGDEIRIQIWQYIPIYPAIIPIMPYYQNFTRGLGKFRSDLLGGSQQPPSIGQDIPRHKEEIEDVASRRTPHKKYY